MADDTESEAGLTEIPASEILNKIQKGEPVEYDNVIIKGDLDIRRLNLPKENQKSIISSRIIIKLSAIDGSVDFSMSLFKKGIDLEEVLFMGSPVNFEGTQFKETAGFMRSNFMFNAYFREAQFEDWANFIQVQFDLPPDFQKTKFRKIGSFEGVDFRLGADFSEAQFNIEAHFSGANFGAEAEFSKSQFDGEACFLNSQFKENAKFIGAQFKGCVEFSIAQFEGEILTFQDAKFCLPEAQELACRKAKNVLDKNGNREDAGYHFYREMDAKRKQKIWYYRYPEYVFIQLIFGYGVHPFRLMFCWFLVATIFAFFYLAKGGIISKLPASTLPQPVSYFVECFYFSIVTAVTPGYGKYELTSWEYQVIASIEAIFGTFMWAAFIATFARKYMRG